MAAPVDFKPVPTADAAARRKNIERLALFAMSLAAGCVLVGMILMGKSMLAPKGKEPPKAPGAAPVEVPANR